MTESKIDLIAKLLAKAESTTPEEAEALTEHAERLMVKYAIDQAVIDERRAREGKVSEKIIEATVRFTGTYRDALVEMGSNVVWGLGSMRPLSASLSQSSTLFIVGFESDVRQAEVLIRSLHVQALVAMRAWWRENAPRYRFGSDWDRRKARDHFIRGFGHGVYARITQNRQQAVEEAGSGTDLVLVGRRERVDAFVDDMGLRKVTERQRRWDGFAQAHGNLAGREANTGEKGLTNGKVLEASA